MEANPQPVSNVRNILKYGLTGAVAAGISFFPFTCLTALGLNYLVFNYLKLHANSNFDDFMLIWFCWLPAAVLGSISANLGVKLASRRTGRDARYSGAIIGGLVAGLIIALWLTIDIYHRWGVDITLRGILGK